MLAVPLQNHILIVEPEQHYLDYPTAVVRDVVDANRYPNFVIRELRGSDAMPDKINAAIDEIDPALVIIVGHGACYSEDTEVLSENGWKRFCELEHNERVATLNSATDELEYHRPLIYHKYLHKGKMLLLDGRRINLLVTPNHRLYASWMGDREWLPFKSIKAEDVGRPGAELQCVHNEQNIELYGRAMELRREGISARKIAKLLKIPPSRVQDWIFYGRDPRRRKIFTSTGATTGSLLKFKRGARWNCAQMAAFELPAVVKFRRVPESVKKVDIEDWLRFFGIWLAEGSASLGDVKGQYIISIAQNNDERRTIIKRWVEKVGGQVGFHAWEEDSNEHSKAIKFKSKQVYEYLRQFGHARDKFIPKEIRMLPPRQLRILLEAMVLGDGHVDEHGEIYYSTASERLAGDVQEIAMKLGMGATINQDEGVIFHLGLTDGDACISKKSMRWVDYDGHVYCVTVPNHILYVRRNGRACWCGNSDALGVECNNVYMVLGDPNAQRMRGRGLHFLSCDTAQQLGPSLVADVGAVFFFGSSDLLWYYIGSPPGSDRASETVWLAETAALNGLCKGKAPEEAQADRLKRYDAEIEFWTTGDGKNYHEATIIAPMLQMDRAIAAMYGGGPAVCAPEGEPLPPPLSAVTVDSLKPLVPLALGLGLIFAALFHR